MISQLQMSTSDDGRSQHMCPRSPDVMDEENNFTCTFPDLAHQNQFKFASPEQTSLYKYSSEVVDTSCTVDWQISPSFERLNEANPHPHYFTPCYQDCYDFSDIFEETVFNKTCAFDNNSCNSSGHLSDLESGEEFLEVCNPGFGDDNLLGSTETDFEGLCFKGQVNREAHRTYPSTAANVSTQQNSLEPQESLDEDRIENKGGLIHILNQSICMVEYKLIKLTLKIIV